MLAYEVGLLFCSFAFFVVAVCFIEPDNLSIVVIVGLVIVDDIACCLFLLCVMAVVGYCG